MTCPFRYLVYNIDKHQDDCRFTNSPTDTDYQNANDGLSVIVDLVGCMRYISGEWKHCDAVGAPASCPGVPRSEDDMVWQYRAPSGEWVFGVLDRGLVKSPRGRVVMSSFSVGGLPQPTGWRWRVETPRGEEQSGMSTNFESAVREVETRICPRE